MEQKKSFLFNENEKRFLKILIENARISDIDIAKKIKISPQAVGKIRKKLESEGAIEGYDVVLNLEKIGVNLLGIIKVNFKPKFWEGYTEEDIKKTVNNSPQMIFAARLINADENLVTVSGYRNQEELEHYLRESMSKFHDFSNYNHIDIFSSKSLIKLSMSSLYKNILEGKNPILEIPKK